MVAVEGFGRQSGYAAFSVSQSRVEKVRCYIAEQGQCPKKIRFENELISLLTKHELEYDERYQHVEEIIVDLKSLTTKLASGKSTILRAAAQGAGSAVQQDSTAARSA